MRRRRGDEADGQELVELAALADGSLAPERRAALEARVAASPELADRLAEQQRAVALTRSAAAEVEAPAALRARIDAQRRARRRPARRRLVLLGGAAAAAVLAVAIGLTRPPFGHLRRALPRRPRADRPGARRQRARRRSPRPTPAGGSSSTPRGFPASRAVASTRRGSATPPACSSRSGRSTRARTSRCGRACRRRTSRR